MPWDGRTARLNSQEAGKGDTKSMASAGQKSRDWLWLCGFNLGTPRDLAEGAEG